MRRKTNGFVAFLQSRHCAQSLTPVSQQREMTGLPMDVASIQILQDQAELFAQKRLSLLKALQIA